jgi:cytochrome c oxidase assembly factor CtaG
VLTPILAHPGQPPAPHDLWGAWNLDPVLLGGFLLVTWAYRRGQTGRPRRDVDTWRARCFAAALAALGVALVSPLDALSGALASAHMVQHMLLVLVAAPLLALSAPSSTILRGSPLAVRRASGRWRRRLRLTRRNLRAIGHPAAVWLLAVGVLWFWHAAVPYDAALGSAPLHVLEHASFLVTAVLFWHLVIGIRNPERVSNGLGVLLVFAMAMQSVFLSLLLTFARKPWYAGYAETTAPWGLDPLTDQHLAGVIMWIPAGALYLAAALALLASWIRAAERDDRAVEGAGSHGSAG